MTFREDKLDMDTTQRELEPIPQVIYLGQLKDFNLGNPDTTIPNELEGASEEAIKEYGEKLAGSFEEVTDLTHYGCIDGRVCECNADGSDPEVRLRRVGGASTAETALNSDALILDTIADKNSIKTVVNTVEASVTRAKGVKRSAHTGTCGAVKGAVGHQRAIATNPNISNATEALMEHPAIKTNLGFGYNRVAGEKVRSNAAKTADWLEAQGWNEPAYVAGVTKDQPQGVERLAGKHKEPGVALVLNTGEKRYSLSDKRMNEVGITPPFVAHIDASRDVAVAIGGSQGEEGVQKAMIAELDKLFAVADDLPGPETPVFMFVI